MSRGANSDSPRAEIDVKSCDAAAVSDPPMPNASRRICRLLLVFVPSWMRSAVSDAEAGEIRPDRSSSRTAPSAVIETFGIAVWRVTMTRRPFGSVLSTRGASWNGRSGPTAGRS